MWVLDSLHYTFKRDLQLKDGGTLEHVISVYIFSSNNTTKKYYTPVKHVACICVCVCIGIGIGISYICICICICIWICICICICIGICISIGIGICIGIGV